MYGLGVSRDPTRKRRAFRARLSHLGVIIDLGRYETSNEACLAYDQAARAVGKQTNFQSAVASAHHNNEVQEKVQRYLKLLKAFKGVQEHGTSMAADTSTAADKSTPGQQAAATVSHNDLLMAAWEFADIPQTDSALPAAAAIVTQQHAVQNSQVGHLPARQAPCTADLPALYAHAQLLQEQHPTQLRVDSGQNFFLDKTCNCADVESLLTASSPMSAASRALSDLLQQDTDPSSDSSCLAALLADIRAEDTDNTMQENAALVAAQALGHAQGQQTPVSTGSAEQQSAASGCTEACAAPGCIAGTSTPMQPSVPQQEQLPMQQARQLPASTGLANLPAAVAATAAVPCPPGSSGSLWHMQQQMPQLAQLLLEFSTTANAAVAGSCSGCSVAPCSTPKWGAVAAEEHPRVVAGAAAAANMSAQHAAGMQAPQQAGVQAQDCAGFQMQHPALTGFQNPSTPAQHAAGMQGPHPASLPEQHYAGACASMLAVQVPYQPCAQAAPALQTSAQVLSFADQCLPHLMQLYQRLVGTAQQHTGLIAISWIAGVRASMAGHSNIGAEAVRFAVLHTCVALVALAVGGSGGVHHMQEPMGLSSNSHLVSVVEGLMQALMLLRSQFEEGSQSGLAPNPDGSVLTAWRQQLQAGSCTAAGQTLVALLQWL